MLWGYAISNTAESSLNPLVLLFFLSKILLNLASSILSTNLFFLAIYKEFWKAEVWKYELGEDLKEWCKISTLSMFVNVIITDVHVVLRSHNRVSGTIVYIKQI